MTMTTDALLCELHAHTTWSDGALTPTALVDLYGANGFDVLVVTDHVLRADDPWRTEHPEGSFVCAENYADYLASIEVEAARARERYDLLVVPGVELTYNDAEPDLAGHALAVGLRSFVSLEQGLAAALEEARAAGAAIIAAHPHGETADRPSERTTRRFFCEQALLGRLVDRWELFNRRETFPWVAGAGLPSVASGDFHREEHLESWKTLLPCAKDERAVVEHLRSRCPAAIARFERHPARVAA